MNKPQVAISETMEQLHKHCEKYLALHQEITDDSEILSKAIQERFGEVDPSDVLRQAEINSIAAARRKRLTDPRKNPFVTTTAQGDLFHDVPVRVPSILLVDGKPVPYYEASIVDGLEYWRARQDAQSHESDRFQEAATQLKAESIESASEAEKLEVLVRKCIENGVDARQVKYAKAQA